MCLAYEKMAVPLSVARYAEMQQTEVTTQVWTRGGAYAPMHVCAYEWWGGISD